MIFFISVLINADDLYLGGIAQLVEHLLCKQGVTGSSPVTSTRLRADFNTQGIEC